MDEGVELAVLAAGVDGGRQVTEQLLVERPAGEGGVEAGGVDADQHCLEPAGEELARQQAGVAAPDGEQRRAALGGPGPSASGGGVRVSCARRVAGLVGG